MQAAAYKLGYSRQQWVAEEVPPACVGSQWERDQDVGPYTTAPPSQSLRILLVYKHCCNPHTFVLCLKCCPKQAVRCWEELSSEHQVAAVAIGYDRWTWDQAMRDCVLPTDDAERSMFALAEDCFAFDSEGKAYKAKIVDQRRRQGPALSSDECLRWVRHTC